MSCCCIELRTIDTIQARSNAQTELFREEERTEGMSKKGGNKTKAPAKKPVMENKGPKKK